MNKSQVGDLLTVIVAFDRRTIGEADIEAWHLILADLPLEDCAQAVKDHYTESRDWIMPVDVRNGAIRIDRRRRGAIRNAELDAQKAREFSPGPVSTRPPLALVIGQPMPTVTKAEIDAEGLAMARAELERKRLEIAEQQARDAHDRMVQADANG